LSYAAVAAAFIAPAIRDWNDADMLRQHVPGIGLLMALVVARLAVTARQNATLSAAERERLAAAVDQAAEAMLTTDRAGRITYVNPAFTRITGFPSSEAIGRRPAFLREDADPARLAEMDAALARGESWGGRLTERRRDGTAVEVDLAVAPLRDATSAVVGSVEVARDITHERALETQLAQAQRMEAVGRLAGGIAHDFNNILAAVLGSASIMRRHLTEKSKMYKYVEIIESSARRGSSLTRQLLTFARKTETIVKPININSLIEETLHLFQRSVTKEIAVVTEFTEDAATVDGDDGQIQQALLNLFLNARDAMPGGGTLSITTRVTIADAHTTSQFSSIKPGPFVFVRVTDTGHGIDRAIQNRVFEPFFTTKESGTGLGLSVVYGVVQSHGGFINLESEPGHGATFSVYLPRSRARIPRTSHQRRVRLPRGRENILVIDDELSVCEIARDMLAGLGYTVYVEHDGKSGADLYRTRQATIDLVLLDINMPVMGGKQAFEVLRGINPQVRIIVVTGYGREGVETSSFSSQVNAIVQKPFQLEMLAMKVREVLDARSALVEEALPT
jgi:PAS domain S-box-containing protein